MFDAEMFAVHVLLAGGQRYSYIPHFEQQLPRHYSAWVLCRRLPLGRSYEYHESRQGIVCSLREADSRTALGQCRGHGRHSSRTVKRCVPQQQTFQDQFGKVYQVRT
jgi:hypothetical protein